jgi:hypothetical protein
LLEDEDFELLWLLLLLDRLPLLLRDWLLLLRDEDPEDLESLRGGDEDLGWLPPVELRESDVRGAEDVLPSELRVSDWRSVTIGRCNSSGGLLPPLSPRPA